MNRPAWYLKDVKEKEKRDWTTQEVKMVYTLRKKHKLTPVDIAYMFGVSITQIHNITRLATKAHKKRCFICGHELCQTDIKKHKGKYIKACSKCIKKQNEYKRKRRNEALKEGKCGYCGKYKVIPGYTSCKKCISATYRRRYTQNLCGRCGKHPIYKKRSIALCKQCLEKNRQKKNK